MKIRQAQTSATYILPDPGELNKRVLIRQRVDMPADNFGVEPQYPIACANNFRGDAECRSGAGNNTRAEHWLAFRHASGTEQCTGGEKHG